MCPSPPKTSISTDSDKRESGYLWRCLYDFYNHVAVVQLLCGKMVKRHKQRLPSFQSQRMTVSGTSQSAGPKPVTYSSIICALETGDREKKRRQDDRRLDRAATESPKPEHQSNDARTADDDHWREPNCAVPSPHCHGDERDRGPYRPRRSILTEGDRLHDPYSSCRRI
jgi:hypothetical protein